MNSDHDSKSIRVPTGPPDFIVRRSNWVAILIGIGLAILIAYGRFGSHIKTLPMITLLCFVVGLVAFLRMPVLGANKFGIQIFKFYYMRREVLWGNVIDADLESNDSASRTNDGSKVFLVLTYENGDNIKLGLDWDNVEYLLHLVKSQMIEHRISAKLKSLFETGEIPLNV